MYKFFYWLRCVPRNIRDGIFNLCYWFPTVWRDRDWDQSFIYEILAKKLEKQALCIATGWSVDGPKEALKMWKCVRLIRDLQEEKYVDEAFEGHFEKWGWPPWSLGGTEKRDPANAEAEKREFNIRHRWGYRRHGRARKKLFRMLEENIEGWWD